MDILVTYDVDTTNPDGKRRLRSVANACKSFGQRVQYSVFECRVDQSQLETLEARLCSIIRADHDSLRIYILHGHRGNSVRAHGIDRYRDFDDTLVV